MELGPLLLETGKIGDIINVLPLAKKLAEEHGIEQMAVLSQRDFAGILEGCSYVKPVVWDGDFTHVKEAKLWAESLGYGPIYVTQIYGRGIAPARKHSSFCIESWAAIGRQADFGLPLVIDRRSAERETTLARHLPDNGLPHILVASAGQSSPFKYAAHLLKLLRETFAGRANIVDLTPIRAERFFDLLGLYERAACLVSVDTGHLHLAWALPDFPVCALITDSPTRWHGAPRRRNHRCYIRYGEYPARKRELLEAIEGALKDRKSASAAVVADLKPAIVHVWSGPAQPDPETARRQVLSRQTWAAQGWTDKEFCESDFPRDGTLEGDNVKLPYIADMVDFALRDSADHDICVLTNADTNVMPGTAHEIAEACSKYGAAFAYRWDFRRLDAPLASKTQLRGAVRYPGSDLFAFTKTWWTRHRADYPDMIYGRECWDWIMRELIKLGGGVELKDVIYHESHDAPWKRSRDKQPGNLHNRSFARAWLKSHNLALGYIANASFREVRWPPASEAAPVAFFSQPTEEDSIDVLYVLGNGSKWQNNELRYSLRSLEKFARGVRHVYVVGHAPGFGSPELLVHENRDAGANKEHNIASQILWACENLQLSSRFLFVNDDHFFLRETDIRDFPYYADGQLSYKFQRAKSGGYRMALGNAEASLKRAKLPTVSYEVHLPIIYNREHFIALRGWWDACGKSRIGFVTRSIYCNVTGVSPTQIQDVKIGNYAGRQELETRIAGRPAFSISDDAFANGIKTWLSETFPERCRWE